MVQVCHRWKNAVVLKNIRTTPEWQNGKVPQVQLPQPSVPVSPENKTDSIV